MLETIRVLYAEDHLTDADLTTAHFRVNAPDIELDVVDTGEKCLARLNEGRYDLLLLDNHLPDMDGIDVLKELALKESSPPVVMVTAVGDEALVVQVLRLGACDYVPKQGNYIESLPGVLRNAVSEWRSAQTQGFAGARRTRHILYVEHNALDIDLTLRLFAETAAYFNLKVVDSAQEALALVQNDNFDLVLTDLRMPDMNALDLLRAIRQLGLRVPFIIVTGKGDEAAAVAALKLGAYDYIVKRENYLTQLPYAIENAIARSHLLAANRRLQIELAQRERTEAQLRHAQKMESIGQLAGGIAHDFNNLLTVINGYADLMLMKLEPQDPRRVALTQIRDSGERAASLTRQLLAFSRKQVLKPRILTLNSLITDSTKMLERLLGEDVELVTVLDSELGKVRADAGQMEQVILNLAVNARDAMPGGGRLTLETRNETLDESYARQHLSLQPGNYVGLTVSDTGIGMNADTISRIFEPFFTTKEPGKGTGLGLSTVYGIVNQSGGSIWLYSEPGLGTTFKIYLPRVDEPVAEAETKPSEAANPRGTETILVVEDDLSVRGLTCKALRNYGYHVIEAANAGEALLACEKVKETIPLMVTDLVMPLMSGRELASRLHQLRPAMRVLYMSGYADEAVVRLGFLDPAVPFIQKPFTPTALALKVREILGDENGG